MQRERNFEEDVMKYFRNIVAKLRHVFKRLDELERLCNRGFRATGTAFRQTKTVVQAVVDEVEQTRADLGEYGGVIEASTFFDPLMRTDIV